MRRAWLAGLVLLAAAGPDKAARLLNALRAAPSAEQAEVLEAQLTQVWHTQLTPAVQLLADHAQAAMAHDDQKAAIGDLDAALDLQADQADLWRLHADMRFAAGDVMGAYADLAQALAREPRFYPAFADLSHFAETRHDYARALQAWRKTLEINPHMKQAEARLHMLERKVNGEQL